MVIRLWKQHFVVVQPQGPNYSPFDSNKNVNGVAGNRYMASTYFTISSDLFVPKVFYCVGIFVNSKQKVLSK